jgi:RNA polymerase sigma factor (sigma-70 family)
LLDIYQETLLDFHRNVLDRKFDGHKSSIKSYIFGIAKNKIRNFLKRNSKKHEELRENDFPVEESDIDQTKLNVIIMSLERMGERCKNILTMFYYYNFDMETIALRMGLASSNVAKKTKYECLRKLKELALNNISKE